MEKTVDLSLENKRRKKMAVTECEKGIYSMETSCESPMRGEDRSLAYLSEIKRFIKRVYGKSI
jgi:hypothetical protein